MGRFVGTYVVGSYVIGAFVGSCVGPFVVGSFVVGPFAVGPFVVGVEIGNMVGELEGSKLLCKDVGRNVTCDIG